MITIEVNLFATLIRYAPANAKSGSFSWQINENTSLAELLQQLQIPDSEFKQVFVNRIRQDKSYCLQAGDRVAIFPPIAGG